MMVTPRHRAVLAGTALLAAFGCPLVCTAADGIAASIAYRWSKNSGQVLVPEAYHYWQGKLVLFHIQDNVTVGCDTLYRGLADFPAFNAYGDKIVFWREGDTLTGNQLVRRTWDCLSVINIDGTGLRDLVTVSGDDLSMNYYWKDSFDRQCQWPAGDWVYYVYPRSAKVYRVNVNDPRQNEFVVDYSYGSVVPDDAWIRRWCLSANGQYAAFQFNPGAGIPCPGSGAQTYLEFPGLPDPCATGIQQGYFAGCNTSMSPSGKFGTHYGANGHTCAGIHRLNWSSHSMDAEAVRFKTTVCIDSIGLENGFTCTVLPHCAPGGYYGGCEWIRWAKNSDKWYLHSCGYLGLGFGLSQMGANQYIVNWYDRELIRSSNNPKNLDSGRTSISYCNDPGDFFVYGGPPGTIEDTSGTWVPIEGVSGTGDSKRLGTPQFRGRVRIVAIGTDQYVQTDLPRSSSGPYLVRVHELSGKASVSGSGTVFPVRLTGRLPRGIYTVRIHGPALQRVYAQVLGL